MTRVQPVCDIFRLVGGGKDKLCIPKRDIRVLVVVPRREKGAAQLSDIEFRPHHCSADLSTFWEWKADALGEGDTFQTVLVCVFWKPLLLLKWEVSCKISMWALHFVTFSLLGCILTAVQHWFNKRAFKTAGALLGFQESFQEPPMVLELVSEFNSWVTYWSLT